MSSAQPRRRRAVRSVAALSAVVVGAGLAGTTLQPASADTSGHGHHGVKVVYDGLDGPRGPAAAGRHRIVVSESDGSVSAIREFKHGDARKRHLFSVPSFGIAPAVETRHHAYWALTGGGGVDLPDGAASLYKWKKGWAEPRLVADISDYQQHSDPDPYDLEGVPGDSNPFGLAPLRDGSVLVSDAGGNDLLRVMPNGAIHTVARLKPRTVPVPDGLPPTDPDGNPLPPAGTPIPSEAVATSVTVGADGWWYVGELRGFPATPGTSQIWRIRPGTTDAVCDPEDPHTGDCRRYKDGMTSVVDLASDRWGNVFATELSKLSWLAVELGLPVPDAGIGALWRIDQHQRKHELAKGQLTTPDGADVSRDGRIYVTGPIFGPGALLRVHR